MCVVFAMILHLISDHNERFDILSQHDFYEPQDFALAAQSVPPLH